jgi:gliding motility-associated-like protein
VVPAPPVLRYVSVNPLSEFTNLNWSLSPSSDIAAYIIYRFSSNYWITVDTIWDPGATSYSYNSGATKYFSDSYVVAAHRLPTCTSPLSNVLSTIFCTSEIDTCKKEVVVRWNKYSDFPEKVVEYRVTVRQNEYTDGDVFKLNPQTSSFTMTDFETDMQYCFIVEAVLENGMVCSSNRSCLQTRMQRPPAWINADYATIGPENKIDLSFTTDPLSEIKAYILERKTGYSGTFQIIGKFSSETGSLKYSDLSADVNKVNFYRLSAVNNCGLPVTVSNIASNITLTLHRNENDLLLSWNQYREWRGTASHYDLFADAGSGPEKRITISPNDTSVVISYSDIMYEVSGNEICFTIKAFEASSQYGAPGESQSSKSCIPVTEIITVPNAFTPDNDLVNDKFRPFLSFTPSGYLLTVTDLQRKKIFETTDPYEEWDGRYSGTDLPEGLFLWFLRVKAPSGKTISRTGTVTIIRNR